MAEGELNVDSVITRLLDGKINLCYYSTNFSLSLSLVLRFSARKAWQKRSVDRS